MEDEPHAVVRLLLARMGSHPEEFRVGKEPFHNRWEDHLTSIDIFGNETDKAAVNAAMRDIRLAEIHEHVMDELLTGPERRRAEMEEAKAANVPYLSYPNPAQQQQQYDQWKQQQLQQAQTQAQQLRQQQLRQEQLYNGGIPGTLKGILK